MDDEPLIDLQVKYAYQEAMLGQLSDALYAQQRKLDELLKRVSTLERIVQGSDAT